MTPSLKPFMAYLEYPIYADLKKFSKKHNVSMSQIIREAILARISDGDRYVAGFNDGVTKAMSVVQDNRAAKMRFPSGKSFAELVVEDLQQLKQNGVTHEKNANAGTATSGTSDEGCSDQGLGL
jgi:hypothetical protein